MSIPCQTALPNQPGHWQFNCSCCLETISDDAMLIIHDHKLCVSCFDSGVRPQFDAALADESQYPVMWDGKEVNPISYRHCFTKDFKDAWKARLKEYKTPLQNRLYCQGKVNSDPSSKGAEICGKFLGQKKKTKTIIDCQACGSQSCARCASSFPADASSTHACSAAKAKPEDDPFAGLTRGVDYQRCPGCQVPVELREACNHMTCRVFSCRTHFCYLCGEEATRTSGHWQYGKPCPLYGRQGSDNAQYDGAPHGDPAFLEMVALQNIADDADLDLNHGVGDEGDIHEDIRRRRADRAQLHEIIKVLSEEVRNAPGEGLTLREREQKVASAFAMSRYVAALLRVLFAYTIDLEPDEAMRRALRRILDRHGPRVVFFKSEARDEMKARFPQVDEIYLRMISAAEPAEPEIAAAA
ncbi:hypothetical protein CLAFUW4_04002 [Fulvia fulva]|uniref:RING-type domain-containing protein n=1 Tax=Passalora fulva TaxID=5499 RepID=A0A9Q8P8Q4_PASFU|nr:uncharacterized protein CLAFUR5_03967 [Fulvia fulva]KAK4626634.1 hypothetical protein CLAFUR4_03988 [Fulvia fulva]KAK4627405.1 hypothetical protein CLAFUR0_03989 [Fulvia fulva]UJO17146.1 hypothetical protein CLAFUR5_03967 [Fulvia fulva]WPV13672.1 hypothetical protein CLAFUW4_04002 [Fulvia fulva]WPV28278.1 hypothetical protein CLAFUW7_03991 [Fulvia fulva]